MVIQGVFRSDLRVTSKAKALEFYKGVKSVILIPVDQKDSLRVEPGQHISLVPKESIRNGTAPFAPSFHDEDGSLAYQNRKYINAYLNDLHGV